MESSVTYENGRNLKEAYFRSAVSSPHCYFKANTTMNPNNPNIEASFQTKPREFVTVQPTARTNQTNVEIVNSPNPYFQTQLPNTEQSSNNNNIAIDAKLLQAQSQFGPAGAAAVAVASHMNIGTTI